MNVLTIWLMQHIGYKPTRMLYALGQTLALLISVVAFVIVVIGLCLIIGELIVIFIPLKLSEDSYRQLYTKTAVIGLLPLICLWGFVYAIRDIVRKMWDEFYAKYPPRKKEDE